MLGYMWLCELCKTCCVCLGRKMDMSRSTSQLLAQTLTGLLAKPDQPIRNPKPTSITMTDFMSTSFSQPGSPVLIHPTPNIPLRFGLSIQTIDDPADDAQSESTPVTDRPGKGSQDTLDVNALCAKLGHRTHRFSKHRRSASTSEIAWRESYSAHDIQPHC